MLKLIPVTLAFIAGPSLQLEDESYLEDGEVYGKGLPALSSDKSEVAYVNYEDGGGRGNAEAGSDFVLEATDGSSGKNARRLSEGAEQRGTDYAAELDARMKAFNAELASFSTLPDLDVVVFDDDYMGVMDPSFIVDPKTIPAAERPVQVMLRNDQLIFRIPGVKVLARIDASIWNQTGLCTPHITDIWADEASGAAVVRLDHGGDCACNLTCECSEPTIFQAATLPVAVFDAVAAHPTERYHEAVETACEADEWCRGW